MRTTSAILGLSVGDICVHSNATCIVLDCQCLPLRQKFSQLQEKKIQSCVFSFNKFCCSSTNSCSSPVDLTNFARFLDKKLTKLKKKKTLIQRREKKSKLLSEKNGSYMAIFSCMF
jgi:hypothetical protein